jgi:hypothetical protein
MQRIFATIYECTDYSRRSTNLHGPIIYYFTKTTQTWNPQKIDLNTEISLYILSSFEKDTW